MTILTRRLDRMNRVDSIAGEFESMFQECSVRIDYDFTGTTWIFIIQRPDDSDLSVSVAEELIADSSIDVMSILVDAYRPNPDDVEIEIEEDDYRNPVTTGASVTSIYGQNPVDILGIRPGSSVYDSQGNRIGTIVRSEIQLENNQFPLYAVGNSGPVRQISGGAEFRMTLEIITGQYDAIERAMDIRTNFYANGDLPTPPRDPARAEILKERVRDVLENKPEGFSIAEFFKGDGTL
jgi:hypothetical protein